LRVDEQPVAGPDARREQILQAALDVIGERGFGETRIADVADRAEVSPALVIYYFKTKDHLLTEAMRLAEDVWYAIGARKMAPIESARQRLEELVAMTCLPESDGGSLETWSVWLDLWAQALRHEAVARVREEFDEHWRETIRTIVREGQQAGEFRHVDVDDFATMFAALLDGLAVQIALEDTVVDAWRAFEVSMRLASHLLGFTWSGERRVPARPAAPEPVTAGGGAGAGGGGGVGTHRAGRRLARRGN
jgi:AcrR family transcriptional regulator